MNLRSLASSAGIFAAFSGLYLLVNDYGTNAVYRGIWIMPLTFVIVIYIMVHARKFPAINLDYTYSFLATLFFVRLVITPLAIHFAGPDYTALSYLQVTSEEVFSAILLTAWEAIVAAIFFFVTAGVSTTTLSSRAPLLTPVSLQGSKIVYGMVAFIGVTLIFAVGLPRGLLNVGSIVDSDIGIEKTSYDMILVQVMIAGAWLSYLLTLVRQGNLFRRSPTLRPFLLALAIGVLLLTLIFGDRRSIQVYTGIAVAATLVTVFPSHKRTIIASVFSAAIIVISAISFWRMFARHDIDLTTAGLLGQSFMATIATSLQSYIGGPYQIAAANSILRSESIGLGNVAFDFLRSTFLVNFFVDDSRMLTSQLLNANIYSGQFLTGWLVFTTTYGAITLGPVFMPIFLILNISLAIWCERKFRRARGMEVKFLFIYLFTRMSFFPFTATFILLSFFTIQLFTIGLIFLIAIVLKGFDQAFAKRSY